ncbi:Late embryogenesis abundant (LEA) hydroxyproline-rich glycoprotein family [Forsythia ovata]|uniref:Late embryogenesis abundant (LEA) hydroxyproline-rich glycoprotein family n=1 Tax=Forsythia ovata TaxID=205694 RepID=A0ABD1X5Y1_9LAMI
MVGAAAATATTVILSAKPRDPAFHLISIDLNSFKFNFPLLDTEMTITVHVTNPNVVSIQYSSTEMFVYYAGSLLGSAPVMASSQPPKSCQLLRLSARLSGLQLAHHATRFLADVARREIVLDSVVHIEGAAKVLWWDHKFSVHVDSHVTVDPLFVDIIDQENKSEMDVFVT